MKDLLKLVKIKKEIKAVSLKKIIKYEANILHMRFAC